VLVLMTLLPGVAKDSVVVNDFLIEYLPNGQVSQFFSDLSVVDGRTGAERQRKTISVNVPLRVGPAPNILNLATSSNACELLVS